MTTHDPSPPPGGGSAQSDIISRKDDHIRLVLEQRQKQTDDHPFDHIRLCHNALPEVDYEAIDLSCDFLGHRLQRPFFISSMTGGPARAEAINRHLGEAATALGIPVGVGSQRVALDAGADAGLAKSMRASTQGVPLFANLGAVQLIEPAGPDGAMRAVDMLEADGLILHLNPLQELMQPGGDRNWSGIQSAIEVLCQRLDKPVIVKEVGFGLSADVGRRLVNCGVAVLDVAGRGGTNFALVEMMRNADARINRTGPDLMDWGLSTVECLNQVTAANLGVPIIASGGIRSGVDGAKAMALGATLFAQAGGVLEAAMASTEAVIDHFMDIEAGVRAVCLLTGQKSAQSLNRTLLI